MKFEQIVDAFSANRLEKLLEKHGPEPFESCWVELVENDYEQKTALVTQLIRAGVDCDWQNAEGLTPMELAMYNPNLVMAMLRAETARFDEQRMVYRLVRRGVVVLLRMFFEMQQVSEMDKFRMVSLALEEAVTKGVGVVQSMQDFCNKLLLTTFYRTGKSMEITLEQQIQQIKERIEIICNEVEFLQGYGTESFTNIDNCFLTSLRTVAENLYVAELLWKHKSLAKLKEYAAWNSLQPTKINYLIMIFLDVLSEKIPDLGLAVDKNLLLDMLNMLRVELKLLYIKDYDGMQKMETYLATIVRPNKINEGWKSKHSQVKLTKEHRRYARNHNTKVLAKASFSTEQQKLLIALVHGRKNLAQIRELWTKKYPDVRLGKRAVAWAVGKGSAAGSGPFGSFSRRTRYVLKTVSKLYNRVKSYYSLTVMLAHIRDIYSMPLTEQVAKEFGFAAFQRIVQVMGEFCKNTKQTPNLQGAVHEHLSLWSSQALLDIFHLRRNVTTHGLSLNDINFRILLDSGELSAGVLLAYCQIVQSELQKTYPHLKYYQLNEQRRIIRGSLGRIRYLKTLEQRESYATMIRRMGKNSSTDELVGLYDFDEIIAMLDNLLDRREDMHLHGSLKDIKAKVEKEKTKDSKFFSSLATYQEFSLKLTESCGNYREYNALDVALKAQLKAPNMYYFYEKDVCLLHDANQILVKIIEGKQYSGATGDLLVALNELIDNQTDRKSQLRMVHEFNQFVPYQNERYTERLLASVGVRDLGFDKFYAVHDALNNRVYDPLNKKHMFGMFAVEQKFGIIKSVLQQNGIQYDAQLLDACQKADGRVMQHLLEEMLESLYQLSRVKVASTDQYECPRALATQYGLLEVCTILSHTESFQSNLDFFNTPLPMLAGRYLRNAIAHDMLLCKSVFFFDQGTLNKTIEVLYEHRCCLLNAPKKSHALPHFGEITEKYRRRKRLAEDQRISTKGKLEENVLYGRLDIYGHYYSVWKEEPNCSHNLLDVLLYYYQEDAIAYIEERSHQSRKSSASSVFSYLWNRLQYSHLLGQPLQRIVNPAEGGVQVEKILCYCLLVKRFDKFQEFFHRYGQKFNFVKFHQLLSDIPDVVDKLAEFLPWGSAKDQGFSMMHSLCASDNVEALKSAIKLLSSQQLSIRSKDGQTPLQTAAWHSSFRAVRSLLESRKIKQLDCFTLCRVLETNQNDMLDYFILLLESDLSENMCLLITIKIVTAVNMDAFNILNEILSANAFHRLCPAKGNFPLINIMIACDAKQTFIKQMLDEPKYQSSFNRSANQERSPFRFDVTSGRSKYSEFLLSNGFAIDFIVIQTILTTNCFKQFKWLLRKSELVLTDSQQQNVVKLIISHGCDKRTLKYFSGLNSIPADDLAVLLETTIQLLSYHSCKFLCETFPSILEHYNRPFRRHPLALAIERIHRNNSLTLH